MYLADGGGGDGLILEFVEKILDGKAEFLLDDAVDILQGKRGDFVLELLQLPVYIEGDITVVGGEHLAELDKCGAEFLEGVADAFAAAEIFQALPVFLPDHLEADFDVVLDIEAGDEIAKAVFDQNTEDLAVTLGVPIGSLDDANASDDHGLRQPPGRRKMPPGGFTLTRRLELSGEKVHEGNDFCGVPRLFLLSRRG